MCRPVGGSREEGAGGHIGPPLHGVGEAFGNQRELARNDAFPGGAGRSPPPYRGSGGVRGGVRSPRPTGATQVVRSSGPMYLRHGFRRPNFVPKFGASVKSSTPTESPINHPNQPARSEASAPADARDGRESAQRPSQKGGTALRPPGQRLAKRKARKEQLVKFGLCPMTSLFSTAYQVR